MARAWGVRRGGAAVGCLIALAVVAVLVIAGVVVVVLNWRGWAASGVESVLVSLVEESELSDAEQGEVVAEVRALTAAFRAKDVTLQELTEIGEKLGEGPIVPAAVVYGARKEYLDPSGLSAEEKAAGELALARVARGVQLDTIDPAELSRVFGPISTTNTTGPGVHVSTPGFQLHLKQPSDVTDEELREVIALAQSEADSAGVEAEPVEIDASEEIAKAIREVLGRDLPKAAPAAPSPAETPASP